jgi:Erythromycin biosynthesis protein CIII-like, C-terminal domain
MARAALPQELADRVTMRILVTSTPGTGHLNALLPLVSAVQSAGHEVLVVTGPESCESVERRGFAVRAGGMTGDARREAFKPRMPEVLALPPRRRRGLFFAGFFAEIAAPMMRIDLTPVFEEFRPDLVISERGELAAGAMAASRNIPHVTVAFSGALPPWSDQLVIDAIEPLWAAEGLPTPTIDQINGDLYLHPFPPSFGQAPPTGNVQPMRAVANADAPAPPPWLDDLGTTRPLIYLTAGTEPAAAEMFPWAEAVAVLGTLDVDAIATVGPRVDPAFLGVVSPNVRVERFVPQHFILAKAAVLVSHSGAGSVLGAAAYGIPQLLFPVRADQWENADAASGAGVAITLELDQRSEDDIGTAIERLLADEKLAQAASDVAGEIAAMPTPADHTSTVEALADQPISD